MYGDPLSFPQYEEYFGNVNPVGERSCYDEGKRGAETLFSDYHRIEGTDTRIIRIFNTYGPRMSCSDGRVIPTLINQALTGEDMTIYGTGKQTRSFMYISDLIDGIYRMMHRGVPNFPVNLGNPNEISINQLVSLIKEMTGSLSNVIFHPLPPDDPKRRCPDISKALSLLSGWRPKVDLDNGLMLTIDYFRSK